MGNEMTWTEGREEGEPEQDSIYDERVGVRRLGFRNFTPNLERLLLSLDLSAESITSSGPPSWLVGSMYMLVPCVFDLAHWRRQWSWREGGLHFARASQPMPTENECLKMLLQIEFLDSGQVQLRSRLLAPLAWEEWRRAMGQPHRLAKTSLLQSLSRQPGPRSLLERLSLEMMICGGEDRSRIRPEAAVIQETLQVAFPMGPYHGSDEQARLVAHQSALSRILLIDPISLAAKQHISYTDLNDSFWGVPCARPCWDPASRELFNVLVQYLPERRGGGFVKYQVVVLPAEAETLQDSPQVGRVVATFMAPPTKLESFAVTPSHIIVPIHSSRYRASRLPPFGSTLVGGVDELLEFQADQDALFYVISREARRLVAVYRSEPAHIGTVVNAFEAPDRNAIYCDVIAADHPPRRPSLAQMRRVEGGGGAPFGPVEENSLRRYCLFRLGEEMARFDGAAGQLPSFPLALFHQLTDYPLFAPLLASNCGGVPYRYCYGLSVDRDNRGRPGFLPNALLKCDLASPIKSIQWHRAAHYPSPPLLVPRPMLAYGAGTAGEDDGVLLSLVLDVHGQRSIIIVLDAKDLCELARYALPFAIPLNQRSLPVWMPARARSLGRGLLWSGLSTTAEITPPEKTALSPIS